jgi:hypothetical protein
MKNTALLIRQQTLLLRSAQLRERLSAEARVLIKPLRVLDQGQRGVQWLASHPLVPASALLVVAVLKPKRTLIWGGRLWQAWKTYQSIKARLLGSLNKPG